MAPLLVAHVSCSDDDGLVLADVDCDMRHDVVELRQREPKEVVLFSSFDDTDDVALTRSVDPMSSLIYAWRVGR